MSDFVDLDIGDKFKLNVVGNSDITIYNRSYYSKIPEINLTNYNWSDYYLQLLSVSPTGEFGCFELYNFITGDKLYEVELYDHTYTNWVKSGLVVNLNNYKTFKPSMDLDEEITCGCSRFDLFWFGCKCGAFQKEIDQKILREQRKTPKKEYDDDF